MYEEVKKRYIISYKDRRMSCAGAAAVLGVDRQAIQDGIELLASEKVIEETDILHFEDLGASVQTLSEDEAENLRKKEEVAEVVEDFPVYALGDRELGKGGVRISGSEPRTMAESFEAGYRKALADLLGQGAAAGPMTSGCAGYSGKSDSPFLCPPGYRFVVGCVPVEGPGPEPPPPPPPPPPAQPIPWNIEMVKAHKIWGRVTGKGVKVAVIDTGIDDDHPDLTVAGGVSFVPGVVKWDDDNGHGTHCAGIIGARNNDIGVVGVAPQSELYAVKVLSATGSGTLSGVLAGMDWAAQNGMHVVSMSLGSDVTSPDAACILAFQRAAEQLIEKGCIVVAAAGNAGRTSTPWVGQPARCPGYMAVAAVDRNANLADFSSRGPATLCPECGVEISAPGVSINSTWNDGKYKVISGTSMACPHVSGAAALLKELHPTWDPARIRARLKATAADLGAPGNDPMFGSGLLDCEKAVLG